MGQKKLKKLAEKISHHRHRSYHEYPTPAAGFAMSVLVGTFPVRLTGHLEH